MNYNLFLDDIRMPVEVGNYMYPVGLRSLFRLQQWVIVRNYEEFIDTIERQGVPKMVSFDHDLADEHYRPSMYNPDGHYSNYYKDGTFKEKTGYDCAEWLIAYAKKNAVPLPFVMCHSMNPVGKENIQRLFADKSHP